MLSESSRKGRPERISLSFPFIPVSGSNLRPESFAIEVLCGIPAFIPLIEEIFRPFLRKNPGKARASILLRIHEGSPALFSLREGEHLSFSTYRSFEVLPYLEWVAISRALAEPSRFLQLHGAALEGEGRGLLMAGPEGSGKTSLTLSLIKEGLGFLTDDVALLHPLSHRVHPFPRPFHVDEALARELSLGGLLGGEFCFDYYYLKKKVIYLNPESIFPGSRAGATPLKLILFLGERKGGPPPQARS